MSRRVSLRPLTPEDALAAFLQVKPPPKAKKRATDRKRTAAGRRRARKKGA